MVFNILSDPIFSVLYCLYKNKYVFFVKVRTIKCFYLFMPNVQRYAQHNKCKYAEGIKKKYEILLAN